MDRLNNPQKLLYANRGDMIRNEKMKEMIVRDAYHYDLETKTNINLHSDYKLDLSSIAEGRRVYLLTLDEIEDVNSALQYIISALQQAAAIGHNETMHVLQCSLQNAREIEKYLTVNP